MTTPTTQSKYEIIDTVYSELMYVYPCKADQIKQWIADHINASRQKWITAEKKPLNQLILWVFRNKMP